MNGKCGPTTIPRLIAWIIDVIFLESVLSFFGSQLDFQNPKTIRSQSSLPLVLLVAPICIHAQGIKMLHLGRTFMMYVKPRIVP